MITRIMDCKDYGLEKKLLNLKVFTTDAELKATRAIIGSGVRVWGKAASANLPPEAYASSAPSNLSWGRNTRPLLRIMLLSLNLPDEAPQSKPTW